MSRLKIALLCDWFLPHRGGIELHLFDLARQLCSRGHEVQIITPIPGEREIKTIRVQRLRALLFPFFGFVWTPRPFTDLADLLRRERYDVVHVHTSYIAPFAWGGAYLCQRLGLPVVFTFHSRLLQFTGVLSLANRAIGWAQWPMVFSGVSEVVRAEIKSLVPAQPLHVLPNATEVAFWKTSEPTPKDPADVVLVTVTRFSPRKRGGALLNIFARVKAQLPPNLPVKLIVIGEGRLRWQLEQRVRRLGLQNDVRLTGYLSRSEIRALFACSDIFVLPGSVESFGIAALEARCAGLPVVARAESGVSAFIQHEYEGLLARSDAEMVTHLVRLIQDQELRTAIARHNHSTAPDYDWQDIIPGHLQAYHEAIVKVGGMSHLESQPVPQDSSQPLRHGVH